MKRLGPLIALVFINLLCVAASNASPSTEPSGTITIDFAKPGEKASPRIGFLGGLRDDTPDALIDPLHPMLWRIGHQFRGRIAGGLPAAIARVQKSWATYKLVMSDLINSHPKDFATYEADVKKLVAQTGDAAATIIWEPANEPDVNYKPIEAYYELYAHAFKALREANPHAQICGPSFAFPSYDKYKAFLDYCHTNQLECNDLSWHYTGWDPHAPIQQKWHLEKMRSLAADYPDQHIREIHCDEWGAGPEKPSAADPGRLQPGRAVVWFYFLHDVYQVDRACRANWGGADDYLGGIITRDNHPYPAYYAYRWYGSMSGEQSLPVEGNDREIAALASARLSSRQAQILVGSIANGKKTLRLELRGLPAKAFDVRIEKLPATGLDKPLAEAEIPIAASYHVEAATEPLEIKLEAVDQNEAFHVLINWK